MIKHKEDTTNVASSVEVTYTTVIDDAHSANYPAAEQILTDEERKIKIQLREEILDIAKKRVQTGEFTMRKELVTEEKTITIPITREELVIENTQIDDTCSDKDGGKTEIIRIPLCEERIEVAKHPELLNDVSVYREQFLEMQRVDATLKKETVHVETKGHAKVIDEMK